MQKIKVQWFKSESDHRETDRLMDRRTGPRILLLLLIQEVKISHYVKVVFKNTWLVGIHFVKDMKCYKIENL